MLKIALRLYLRVFGYASEFHKSLEAKARLLKHPLRDKQNGQNPVEAPIKSMLKKTLFLLLLSTILLLAVFWQPVFGSFLETCLNRYCTNHFGSELISEGVYRQEGYWVIEKPKICYNGNQLSAEKLLIGLGCRPLAKEINLELIVEKSSIELGQELTSLQEIVLETMKRSLPTWLLSINSTFTVDKGTISWNETSEGSQEKQKMGFHFYGKSASDHKQACLELLLDGKQSQSNFFKLAVSAKAESPLHAKLTFRQVECVKIAQISEALGNSFHGWKVEEGKIDGKIHLVLPENERPYAWGDVTLAGFSFSHSERNVAGKIQEAKFDLKTDKTNGRSFPVIGKVEISDDASVVLHQRGVPFWEVKELVGGIYFSSDKNAKIEFTGLCSHNNSNFHLSIDGDGCIYDESQASLDVVFRLGNSSKQEAVARFVGRQLGTLFNCAEIELKNIGKDEFAFIQEAFGKYSPKWQGLHMHEGSLNASGIAYMQGYQITDLKIDNILACGLVFDFDPLDLSLSVGNTSGNFSLNLTAPDVWKSINGDFSVTDGRLKFLGFNGKTCRFQNISTNVAIRNGIIQKSEMKGEFAGLKGSIIVDWLSRKDVVKVNFSGGVQNLSPFLPCAIKQGIEQSFSKDCVNIVAVMAWKPSGATVSGECIISQEEVEIEEKIAFGFDIGKSSEKLWKCWPANDLALSFWDHAGLEAMLTILPPIVSPAILLETNWIKAESGFAGLVVKNGWFCAHNLSLEKYVTPFVFPKEQMHMKGRGNFNGVFDHNRMAVEYDLVDFVLDNEYLVIEAKQVRTLDKPKQHAKLYAAHYFDFAKGTHFGSIPLMNASYFDKNSGLLFTNTTAYVNLEEQKIRISDIETHCNGLYLAGAIDFAFDLHSDDRYEVKIHSHTVKGKVSQLKHLLFHFNQHLGLLHFPLEGDLSYRGKGGLIHLFCQPNDYQVQIEIQGAISNGNTTFANASQSLEDLKLNFAYNHERNYLEFSNIHGTLKMDSTNDAEEYTIAGEYIRFDDYTKDLVEFDVWVGDQTRDIIRLVGKTLPGRQSEDGSHRVEFHINHDLTHFGDVHPANFQLVVKDWTEVEVFQIALNMRLNTLLHDLQRFTRSGVHCLSQNISKGINNVKSALGELRIDLRYDNARSEFTYFLRGNDLVINNHSFDSCYLKGTKKENYWCIDELRFNDALLSAHLTREANKWNVHNLVFQSETSTCMELEGIYFDQDNVFEGHVNYIVINLPDLGRLPAFKQFVEVNSLHGIMKGNGEIRFEFTKNTPSWRIEAILDSSFSSFSINGLHYQDTQNVSCHFLSDKSITLRNLHTSLIDPNTQATRGHIRIEKAMYEFVNDEVLFDKIHFSIPSHHLPWFANQLVESFPYFVVPSLADVISSAKLQGKFEGSLQLEMNSPYATMRLTLNDGRYHFLNSEHDLSQFALDFDPFEFKLKSKYKIGEQQVWLYSRSTSPTLSYGELLLTERKPEELSNKGDMVGLLVHWENDVDKGFSIRDTQGTLAGISFKLQRDPTQPLSEEAMFLLGEVGVNAKEAKLFFPEEMAKKVEDWNIGDGYVLKGKWRLQKGASQDYADKLNFVGALEARNFVFQGYQFDFLSSQLEYTPKSMRIRDLNIRDTAGTLSAQQIDLVKDGSDHWYFSMPFMKVNKFTPSLLREPEMSRPTIKKPLVIRELVLEGCQGSLADSSKIIGQGHLHFSNRSKKLLQNTIFQIPADILSRIGLDLSILTPVTGTINYSLENGKIYLNKFKDIYSESKLSRFYLSSSSPSFMEFDGRLNIQVRMKQYNLLFKLTEPFTVAIQGTLQNPTYSLQK